jgi:exonuclease III
MSSKKLSMANNLSCISWNVRSLNSPARREVVRDMIKTHRPTLVCLQEIKLENISRQIAMEILGQPVDGFHFLPA